MDDCDEIQFKATKRKSSESSASSSSAKRSCSDLSLFPVHQHHQHHQTQQSPQTSFSAAADRSHSCQQHTHIMSPLCSIFSSARVRRGSSESRSSSMIHQQTHGAKAHSTSSLPLPPESSKSSNFSLPRSTMFSMIASSNPKSQPSIFLPSAPAPQPPQPSMFLPSETASHPPQPFFSVSRMLEHNQQDQEQKEHPAQQKEQPFSTTNLSSLRQDNIYLEQQQQHKEKSLSAEANLSGFHGMLMGRNASLSNVFRYQPRAECNPKSSMFYPPANTISSNNNHAMSLSDLTASGVPRTKNVAGCSDMKIITNSSMPNTSLLTALSSWQALKSQVSTAPTQHPPSDDCGGLYGVAMNSTQLTSHGPAYNISTQKTPSEAPHSGSLGCEDDMDQVMESEFDSSGHSSCFTADSAFSEEPQSSAFSEEPQSWELSLDQGKNTYGISQSFVSPAVLEQEMLGGGSSLVPEDSAGELPTLSPGPVLFHPDRTHTQFTSPFETLPGVSTVTSPDGTVRCLSERDSSCVDSLKDPLRDSLQESFRDSFRDSICSRISLNSNYSSLTFATAGTNATRKPKVRRRNAIVGPLMFGLGETPEREENDQFSF